MGGSQGPSSFMVSWNWGWVLWRSWAKSASVPTPSFGAVGVGTIQLKCLASPWYWICTWAVTVWPSEANRIFSPVWSTGIRAQNSPPHASTAALNIGMEHLLSHPQRETPVPAGLRRLRQRPLDRRAVVLDQGRRAVRVELLDDLGVGQRPLAEAPEAAL